MSVPDVPVKLPGLAVSLPDDDVFAIDLRRPVLSLNRESEDSNLSRQIAAGVDLHGVKVIDLHSAIDGALPEVLYGGASIHPFTAGRKKGGIFGVKAGDGRAIPGIEGRHESDQCLVDVGARVSGQGCG